MKKMKQAVAVFLIVSLTVFVGCGSDDKDNKSDPAASGGGGGLGGLGGGGIAGGTGGGGTGGGGTGGGGTGGGGTGGGGTGGGGNIDFANTPLNTLTPQQKVTVCQNAHAERVKQYEPTTDIGKGACLLRAVGHAFDTYEYLEQDPLEICISYVKICKQLSVQDSNLRIEECLDDPPESQCTAPVSDYHSCVYNNAAYQNEVLKTTAHLSCESVFSSEDALSSYIDTIRSIRDFPCTGLEQQCPEMFEDDDENDYEGE